MELEKENEGCGRGAVLRRLEVESVGGRRLRTRSQLVKEESRAVRLWCQGQQVARNDEEEEGEDGPPLRGMAVRRKAEESLIEQEEVREVFFRLGSFLRPPQSPSFSTSPSALGTLGR